MEPFKQHFVQDLTQTIKDRHCGSIVFNADNESNVVSVSLFNGSEPVAISGSVVGSVVCPDGATVPLTGSYSGNTASVTLTGDCFAVLGQISVGIQIVNGTQKITVLKAYYDVEALTTENVVDPGSRITLEVGDLVDAIDEAVATIPEDYSALSAHFPATGKFVVGTNTSATEENAVAEGEDTIASGLSSHAEGYASEASGDYSHSEGGSVASGGYSHAEGSASEASGDNAHAEGYETTASSDNSHSEGWGTTASGMNAHAEGVDTVASGNQSHSEGEGTIANHAAQSVSGTYNVADTSQAAATAKGNYAEIVGNGTADNARSNARTLDWSGNEALSGDLTINKNGANEMTVGEELSDLKSAVDDLDDNLYTDTEVTAGGSAEYAVSDTFNRGNGNIRYLSSTFETEYEINKIKIRAYKNASAAYTFKLITVAFDGNNVYVRKVGSEITLDAPTDTFKDYTITLETPFSVPAGQMAGVCASDDKWLYYSTSGSDVTYYYRTQAYSDVVADFRLQTYLSPLQTGKLPFTFYSSGKEFVHIYDAEEIGEIAQTATAELSEEIDAVSVKVDELAENKNTASSLWQSGVWQNNSSDSVAANDRFICTKNAVPDSAGTIINDDTTNYKYVITGYDMSATYHGKGTYNTSTGAFEMYTNNYITAKEFDLDALRKKFPAYEFRISLCKTADAVVTVDAYSVLRFMAFRSYDKQYIDNSLSINKAIYVSTTGSDTNSGLLSTEPVLTVNRALELGATDVLISGGVYEQTIDLSKCNDPIVRIKSITPTSRVVFYAPDSLIASSETQVSGYTNVYSASTDHTFPDTTSRIFQDGIPDATTEIEDSDRHPLQRGNFYRCEDTKIYKCTSTTLSNALSEIENADVYKWFYNDGTIYFSRPQAVTALNPLRTGLYSTTFIQNGSRSKSVELVGIEIKYMRLNLTLASARIIDCKVANACGGGIIYNGSIALELIRCEAVSAYSGGLGDGICATGESSYGMAKGTTVTMIDCWAHDNNDDGFSDHVGCESTIIGGLYEHNGKGGILPTGGGNCTCYNVTSRNNAIGFEIAGSSGAVASGRNGQQIVCFDCIAEENSQYGYFCASNQDMTMRLYSCKAISNKVGFFGPYNVESSDFIAVDCGGYGNQTLQTNSITVISTTGLT